MGERPALDILHRDVGTAFEFPDLMDGNDVRMVESCGGASFAEETHAEFRTIRHAFGQQLECDAPVELRIVCEVHFPHTPGTDPTQDLVVGKGRAGSYKDARLVFLRLGHRDLDLDVNRC
jgi:hypothetical protein